MARGGKRKGRKKGSQKRRLADTPSKKSLAIQTDARRLDVTLKACGVSSAVTRQVLRVGSTRESSVHGPSHWARVASYGRMIAEEVTGVDLAVVGHFALFHDAMRQTEGDDPGHGARGAGLADSLQPRLSLSDPEMALLLDACVRHTDGEITDDPTLGACWDADRLNLGRVGVTIAMQNSSLPGADDRYNSNANRAEQKPGPVA